MQYKIIYSKRKTIAIELNMTGILVRAPKGMPLVEFLMGLAKMYAGGGDITTNIDNAGGKGTALFAHDTICAIIEAKTGKDM